MTTLVFAVTIVINMVTALGTFEDFGIGSRLRAARVRGGISARQLDRLAGISEGYSAMIESGGRDPGSTIAGRLARVLGVSLDWLIAGEGNLPSAKAIKAAIEVARKTPYRD